VDKPNLSKQFRFHIGLVALSSLALGAAFQSVLSVGGFWQGFIAASLLIFLSGVAMYLLWRAAGAQRAIAWMMLAAFLLRLILSVFLAWGLPRFGYDEPPQRAGFVFFDSFRREGQAWTLSQSGDSLFKAFSDEFGTDQYGGMLTLSAAIYRTFSRDAFRPGLVAIVAAGAFSLSLPFLVTMLRKRFGLKIALWAGWIIALYPEGVLLGASQMREGFYILFICMLLWSAGQWIAKEKLNLAYLVGSLATVGLLMFSYRVAISALGFILIWIWFEWTSTQNRPVWRIIRWIGLAVVAVVIMIGLRGWLVEAALWDTLQTYRASGRIQFHLAGLVNWLHSPLIWAYGIIQPFFPAAVTHPAPWIWRVIAIFRASGWYLMLPLLVYALFRVWKLPSSANKQFLVIAIIFIWMWIGISSIRAGGGQWDNPRYRTIFLPVMAALGGWGIVYARETRDRWFTRVLLIEGIFLGFFTQWYLSRYYHLFGRLKMEVMILAILILSAVVILMGWLYDRNRPPWNLTEGEEST
jgi:hypothetical protein